jgi:hypothetical protein
VESCTAVVEHLDGRFEVIRWAMPASLAIHTLSVSEASRGG